MFDDLPPIHFYVQNYDRREHPDQYQAMVKNGLARVRSMEAAQMVAHGLRLIQTEMEPADQRWTKGSELSRQWFRSRCPLQESVNAWQRRLRPRSPARSKQPLLK
jgi:hypothetical protein